MNDRFTIGFISGALAGIISSMVNLIIINIFRFGSTRYIDFAGVMIYGRRPENLAEDIFAYLAFIIFSGILAEIFVYLIKLTGKENYWFKAILFGVGSWFFIYAITILYAVSGLKIISFHSAISNFFASFVYGLFTGIFIYYFEKKTKNI